MCNNTLFIKIHITIKIKDGIWNKYIKMCIAKSTIWTGNKKREGERKRKSKLR